MDILVGLGILFAVFLLIVPIAALFSASNAKLRVRALEAELARHRARIDALEDALEASTTRPQLPIETPALEKPVAPDEAREMLAPVEPIAVAARAPEPPPRASMPTASQNSLAPREDLETKLGSRWSVWTGALAIALGGIFLVRYSIESGLLGPEARIALGFLLAAALLGAGEYARRKGAPKRFDLRRRAPVAALLTAVGTLTAFASAFAAYALYSLIGPTACFALLAAIALSTLLAAALHGRWVAGLGLLGALASPLLVATPNPDHWMLAIYLLVVSAAGYAAAVLRGWPEIGRATLAGAASWALLLALSGGAPDGAVWLYLIGATAIVGYVLAYRPHAARSASDAALDREAHLAIAALAAATLVGLALHLDPAGPGLFAYLALLVLLAWRVPAIAGASAYASMLALAALLKWPPLPDPNSQAFLEALRVERPDRALLFLAAAAAASALVACAALDRVWRSADLRRAVAATYVGVATLLPLAMLALVWMRMSQFGAAPEFGIAALALAAGLSALAVRLRASPGSGHAVAFDGFAGGALAAIALGLTMTLDRGHLTVALALAAAGGAYVDARGRSSVLRSACAGLALIVLARTIWNPSFMEGGVGDWPFFNWLLYGYGVPALAFHFAARWLSSGGEDKAQRLAEGLSLLFAALLVLFSIRHALHGEAMLRAAASHGELGLYAALGAGASALLLRAHVSARDHLYGDAAAVLAGLAGCTVAFGLLWIANPLRVGESVVGGALANSLALGYALPAIAFAVLFAVARGRAPPPWPKASAGTALVLAFAYLSLETRRVFRGPDIAWLGMPDGAELWSYSVVWLSFGAILLVGGAALRVRDLRLASAAFVLPAVVKVFAIDMAELEGAWRAFSFIGLGVALMGIGYLYQALIFARPNPPDRRD